MRIGYLGLGKMGYNMVSRLKTKGHTLVGYDPDETARQKTAELGVEVVDSYQKLVDALPAPRVIWSMIPQGHIDATLTELIPLLEKGDLFVEAANSQYEETMRRAKEVTDQNVRFMDVGVSGGPRGALEGACLMIGGLAEDVEEIKPLLEDIAKGPEYWAHFGTYGAGHYVKMIHNGIEYGMMQAIGEGAVLLKNSDFNLTLPDVFALYNHGSVIESRLVAWTESGFRQYGEELADIAPSIGHSGEGEWTVREAAKQNITIPVITDSFRYRVDSAHHPSYIGRVVNMIRNQFGGHPVGKDTIDKLSSEEKKFYHFKE